MIFFKKYFLVMTIKYTTKLVRKINEWKNYVFSYQAFNNVVGQLVFFLLFFLLPLLIR